MQRLAEFLIWLAVATAVYLFFTHVMPASPTACDPEFSICERYLMRKGKEQNHDRLVPRHRRNAFRGAARH
jgi:hypothetical protein